MKYIKTYEDRGNDLTLEKFFQDYERFSKSYPNNYDYLAKMRSVPEFLMEEYRILYFLYEDRSWWRTNIEKEDRYIKEQVKKYAIKSILDKIDKNPSYLFELQELMDKNKNFANRGRFGYIDDASLKYIFYVFRKVLKDKFLTDISKYNL